MSDEDEQRRALDELHAQLALAQKDEKAEVRGAILQNGFLPDHPRVLIDAGLRMLPVLESAVSEGPAAGRLRAIILKLKLLSRDEAATAAARELEASLLRYEQHDRFIGWVAGLVVLAFVGGLIWFFVD